MAYDPIQHDLLYIRNRIILLKKVLLVKVAYFCVNSFYHHFLSRSVSCWRLSWRWRCLNEASQHICRQINKILRLRAWLNIELHWVESRWFMKYWRFNIVYKKLRSIFNKQRKWITLKASACFLHFIICRREQLCIPE